jgi:hypothetical protein
MAGLHGFALLIDSSRACSRQVISGMAKFNQEQQRWRIESTPRDPLPGWLNQWQEVMLDLHHLIK